MGDIRSAAPIAGLDDRNGISTDDVLMLRRDIFRDGVVTFAEAEALFVLDRSRQTKCAEWPAFFIEAIGDFIVHQAEPRGYVSDSNANWLIRAVSFDGATAGATELDMLISVLEKARSAPASLAAFALKQVAGSLGTGMVGEAEANLMRRILHAGGGEGGIAISRAEAEVLFDVNDRTRHLKNDPSWNDLFAKAIANFVLCASGHAVPSREQALARDAFFADAEPDLGQFFGRMVSGGAAGVIDAFRESTDVEAAWAERNARRVEADAAAAAVDAGEAKWLADRIGRNQPLGDSERELLTFIKRHAGSVHPDLQPLLNRVA